MSSGVNRLKRTRRSSQKAFVGEAGALYVVGKKAIGKSDLSAPAQKYKKLWKGTKNVTSNILSSPARRKAKKIGKIADMQVAAIKFNRQGVPRDPSTKLGQKAMMARIQTDLAKKGQYFKSGFMAGIKDVPKGPFKVKQIGPFFKLKGRK